MRVDRIWSAGACAVLLTAVMSGCGSAGSGLAPPSPPRHVGSALCGQRGFVRAPLPQESGVYRAGPLALVTGEDLAQESRSALADVSGTDAIVAVTGDRPVSLMVDPRSTRRFSLQFVNPTFAAQAANGEAAVRFPACGHRVDRFIGGISFRGRGCVVLWVRPTGAAPIPMLIPIGNTLRGCPTERSARTLGSETEPFLGVACHSANSIRCGRVGVGVSLKPAATLVTVEIAGQLVTLTPPGPPNDLWLGYLYTPSLRRGPLAIHIPPRDKLWFGEPEVHPRVRLTVFFGDGRVASAEFTDFLHPGYG